MLLPGLVFGFVLCTFFSCRKENVMAHPSNTDSAATFSATVAGVVWQTDSVSAFLVNQYPSRGKIMTITGYTANRVITISLKDTSFNGSNDSTIKPQQYAINNRMPFAAFSYANNWIHLGRNYGWQEEGSADSGQATVTASDGVAKIISGTFSFQAISLKIDSTGYISLDTVNVTNGVFTNIPYTYFRH